MPRQLRDTPCWILSIQCSTVHDPVFQDDISAQRHQSSAETSVALVLMISCQGSTKLCGLLRCILHVTARNRGVVFSSRFIVWPSSAYASSQSTVLPTISLHISTIIVGRLGPSNSGLTRMGTVTLAMTLTMTPVLMCISLFSPRGRMHYINPLYFVITRQTPSQSSPYRLQVQAGFSYLESDTLEPKLLGNRIVVKLGWNGAFHRLVNN
ncbi:hypothetical protein GGR55DRAFT_481119 [Xylaria sp. FL0064]|nr:hypothetical protein GGR55DRAFT_481119 [Xylaria sp. FL0064]